MLNIRWLSFSGFGLLAAVWELAAQVLASPVFPPFSRVLPALWYLAWSGQAWHHTLVSIQHISLGFLWAAISGVSIGIAMTQYRPLALIVTPVVDAVRPVAALTIFPLLILILGVGLWSKTMVIWWTAWPPILLTTVQSVRQVDPFVIEAARLDGAGRRAMLTWIILPLATPGIITGLRIGLGSGWISLVAAEMLGSSAGLGYAILVSSQTFAFPAMYAVIILIALIGLAMNSALAGVQRMVEVQLCVHT